MKAFRAVAILLTIALINSPAIPQTGTNADLPGSNLKAGQRIPELSATDQFGKQQNFDSLKGRNGVVLVFFRSADW